MPLLDMHNNKKIIQLETHSPIFISKRPCPCSYPYSCTTYCPLLRTLHQMSELLIHLFQMGTDDFSQVPLVVPTPLEAAKYIATPCQDNLNPVFYISIKVGVVYIHKIEDFLCPMIPQEYGRQAGCMRTIELWVLYLMVVVYLKLKQTFKLAVCRVCLLAALMDAFRAG